MQVPPMLTCKRPEYTDQLKIDHSELNFKPQCLLLFEVEFNRIKIAIFVAAMVVQLSSKVSFALHAVFEGNTEGPHNAFTESDRGALDPALEVRERHFNRI